jgi:hypothetical protein
MNDPSQIRQPILMLAASGGTIMSTPAIAIGRVLRHHPPTSTTCGPDKVNVADSRGFDAGWRSINVTS